METQQIRNLLNDLAQNAMELSERIGYNQPFTDSEIRLIRMATIPAIQEMYEVMLTHYLVGTYTDENLNMLKEQLFVVGQRK